MLSYDGKINEYNSVANELQNVTLLDIIREFNNRSNNSQGGHNWHDNSNQLNTFLDVVAKQLGYYDRLNMMSQCQYSGTSTKITNIEQQQSYLSTTIHDMNGMLQKLAEMYGYKGCKDLVEQNANVVIKPIDKNETLLRIDLHGNVWVEGKIENNPTRIGNSILKMSKLYRDNFKVENIAQYLDVDEREAGTRRILATVQQRIEESDDLPF